MSESDPNASTKTVDPTNAGRNAFECVKSQVHLQKKDTKLDTFLAHAGVESSVPNAPMAPPLHLSSTYTRPPDVKYNPDDSIYSRMDNPTRLLLETTVGRLEVHGGEATLEADQLPITCAFASGMMAASAIIQAHSVPLTVLLPNDLYHGVTTALFEIFQRWGVRVRHVHLTDIVECQTALEEESKTANVIVWMETPSNPLCQVLDIKTICGIVQTVEPSHSYQITTVVDSTLAPPVLTRPFLLGADIVLHSATKYLGGHSDLLLGVASASPFTKRGMEMGPLLRHVLITTGGVASSFDAWLTLRGLRTLHVRVERQCRTALAIARYLHDQIPGVQPIQYPGLPPRVQAVHYPGLGSHPQHDVAVRQMRTGFGGVLSFELDSEANAIAFTGALQVFQRATSLGGTESLVEHRASIEPANRVTSPPGLIRMSIGLEDLEDLIHDLDTALSVAEQVIASSLDTKNEECAVNEVAEMVKTTVAEDPAPDLAPTLSAVSGGFSSMPGSLGGSMDSDDFGDGHEDDSDSGFVMGGRAGSGLKPVVPAPAAPPPPPPPPPPPS